MSALAASGAAVRNRPPLVRDLLAAATCAAGRRGGHQPAAKRPDRPRVRSSPLRRGGRARAGKAACAAVRRRNFVLSQNVAPGARFEETVPATFWGRTMTPAYRDWVDNAKAVTLDTILSKRSIK